jgi:hypothetical protein
LEQPINLNFGSLFIIALASGALSGIISPLVLSWLQHKCIWKSQKKLEVKYSIFEDAVRALSLLATDAFDLKLQSEKTSYKGRSRQIELRPETSELIENSRGMVKAFFTETSYKLFDAALKARISFEEVPCLDFENKRTAAIVQLSQELGIK